MPEAQTIKEPRTRRCAAPVCGREFEVPKSWPSKKYCELRCWTKNGQFGSARNGRLEEQHARG